MKIVGMMLSICITLVLLGIGCSNDEPPPDSKEKAVVRKAIPRPKPQQPRPRPAQPVRPVQKPEPKQEPKKVAQVNPPTEPAPVQPQKTPQTVQSVKTEEGVYVVKESATLPQIAGKKEIYGDPLKWPILFQTNRNVLSAIGVDENLFGKALPLGTQLKIITPKQAQETLKTIDKNLWAINVISVTSNEEIVPSALKLLNNRYPTYITRTNVKGVDYMRLRVGFFKTKTSADTEGKRIVSVLRIKGVWPAKVGEQELAEYGGYLGTINK